MTTADGIQVNKLLFHFNQILIGLHSGDMRDFISGALISKAINLANYAISSSAPRIWQPYTTALIAAHNAVGMYQNGKQVHGGSGFDGVMTLDSSVGNEFSHEAGHNYGLGHYVDGFKGSVHRSSNEINSSWGWDGDKNVFIPNFSPRPSMRERCLKDSCNCSSEQCQSPFLGKYQYGRDAMAGGGPMWDSNRFTLYTPNSSR